MNQTEKNIELSLVFPVYNEEETIPLLKQELDQFFLSFPQSYELVFVNDGSSDRTSELLGQWALEKDNIKCISFPENRGHQEALIEGLRNSCGNYIVTMDADLQDPINLIPEMISMAQQGFDIVHSRRVSRQGEPLVRKAATWIFYRCAHFFHPSLLLDVGDFRLTSRSAIKHYFASVRNPRILRREFPKLSMNQAVIAYRRKPRLLGKSKFNFLKLAELGMRMISR